MPGACWPRPSAARATSQQNLLPDGQFVDRRNARTGLPVTGPYDPRRHFGALWAMLDVRGHDPAVQAAAAAGVRWAFNRYYQPTAQGGAFRSDGWLVTGCSGLALLALDELAPEHARPRSPTASAEIVDFLLAHQITDGARRHDFPHRIALRPLTLDLARDEVAVRPQIAPAAQHPLHRRDPVRAGHLPVDAGRLGRTARTRRFAAGLRGGRRAPWPR